MDFRGDRERRIKGSKLSQFFFFFEKLFYKQEKWAKPERESGVEEDCLPNRLKRRNNIFVY